VRVMKGECPMTRLTRSQTETPIHELPEESWTSRLAVKNLLCPVDFSEFSLQAFRFAAGIARHFQARLIVQHTIHVPTTRFAEGLEVISPQEMLERSRREAEKDLDRLIAESGTQGTEICAMVSQGDVQDSIVRTVGNQDIDLIVMGTHGRKGMSRLLLGSVAEHIVHEAVFCPVLVVSRPQTGFVPGAPAGTVQLKTILAATDFSPDSARALTHALRWASEWNGKVILFHAVEDPPPRMHGMIDLLPELNPYFDKEIAEAWERIQRVIPEAARKRCELVCEVRQGNPREQILQYAAEQRPDLIVMGSRGTGRSSVIWGSTISAVVRDGRFPVLSVRHLRD
jgi:nucleotide-binding universal stress UspA family protein